MTRLKIPAQPTQKGFTIVELLIVIVIIGILAVITIVAFNGVQERSKVSAAQSGATQAAKRVMAHAVQNSDLLPVDLATAGVTNDSTTYQYTRNTTVSPQLYCITATNGGTSSHIASGGQPTPGPCPGHTGTSPIALASGPACPAGYIVVPGSSLFNTRTFCVMKYEARDVAGVATSQAAGTPWVSISQTTAISTATAACSGCRLMSEAEWLTIAHNVLSVASNWSGGAVGSGFIFSGHSDAAPNNAIAASTNDSDGYNSTGNISPSNQRRTLTLSNGAVIWDMAGNVYDITNSNITGNQPGIPAVANGWHQFNTVTILGDMPASTMSNYGTPAASGWTTTQGIGALYSNRNQTITSPYLRGGHWDYSIYAGVHSLNLDDLSPGTSSKTGFRVTR